VGDFVGCDVGCLVGEVVGTLVGAGEGELVGDGDGSGVNWRSSIAGGQLPQVNELAREASTLPNSSQEVPAPHCKRQSPEPHNKVKWDLHASLPLHATKTSVAVIALIYA
jgi:hypothetical protein